MKNLKFSLLFLSLLCCLTTSTYSQAQWTILVYLDADNDLEPFGISDINEMEAIGSTSNVNIVVQLDRSPDYDFSNGDWASTKRYLIQKGTNTALIQSPVVQDIGEANMGDAATLTNFIKWGATNYPAQHYALVLWNHGGGWQKKKGLQRKITKDICVDETDNDVLQNIEVSTGISNSGIHLDLIGFDACLMGMVENAYQLKSMADVMVASEETEPGDGWPYSTILQQLTTNPTMTASSFAQTIVTKYAEDYTSTGNATTQAAIDLTKIDAIKTAINTFATAALATDTATWRKIIEARNNTDKFTIPENKDLGHFASLVYQTVTDATVKQAALDLKNAITQAIILFKITETTFANSQGLAIYFPDASNYQALYAESATDINFINDSKWNEFLKESFMHDIINGSGSTLDANEPNDTWAIATGPLLNDTPITGYIEDVYDFDFYRIEVPAISNITITLKVPDDFALFLFSINGDVVRTIDESDYIGSYDESINVILPKGIYYAVVLAFNPSTLPYEIEVKNIAQQNNTINYNATLAYDFNSPTTSMYGTTVDDAIACQFPLISNTAKLEKIWVYVSDLNINGLPGTNAFDVIANDYYGSILSAPIPCIPTDTGWKAFDVSAQNISLFGNFTVGVRFDGINAPGIGYDPAFSFGNTIFYSTDYIGGFIEDPGTYSIRADISYNRNPSVAGISQFKNEFETCTSYPNPCTNYIVINLTEIHSPDATIDIYDAYGKLIETTNINTSSEKKYKFDTSTLATGVYMYTVTTIDGSYKGKFLKN